VQRRVLRRRAPCLYPLQVLYWLKRGVKVKPRLGFKGTSESTIAGPNFVQALSEAMATAR
jgi:hypothetical protein